MEEKKIIVTDYTSYTQNDIEKPEKSSKKHYYFEKKAQNDVKKPSIKDKFINFKNAFWDWTHTKQALRVFVFSIIAVLVIVGIFLWSALSKVKISEYFLPEVQAFVYNTSLDAGTGTIKTMDILDFQTQTTQEHFQTVTFTAKEQSTIYLKYLYFSVSSEYSKDYDLSIIIKNHSFPSDYIYNAEIHFKEQTTITYRILLDLIVSSPNNETVMILEFTPKDDSIPFSIGDMKFIK